MPAALKALADRGVCSIWFEGTTLKYNEETLALEQLTENDGGRYSTSLEK